MMICFEEEENLDLILKSLRISRIAYRDLGQDEDADKIDEIMKAISEEMEDGS